MIQITLAPWSVVRDEATRIRYEVFVEEQRVPLAMELDEFDPQCVHALARNGVKVAVGTGRLLPDGHIGRMAVSRSWRGKGVGGEMLERLVAAARERGHLEVVLSAQTHALEFYRRHGFVAEGGIYLDADIPHQMMRRRF